MKQGHKSFLTLLLASVFCSLGAAHAQTATLTAEHEEILGVDATRTTQLKEVYDDKSRAQGDKILNANANLPALDLTKVWFGNAAGNRWIFALDFAADFQPENSSILLYLDTDNDPKTGRQAGIQGPDWMVWFDKGEARAQKFRLDGTVEGAADARAVAIGNRVYFSIDADIRQAANQSDFRMMILCEIAEPRQSADNTPFFPVVGEGVSNRPKRVSIGETAESENVQATWGLHTIEAIKTDKNNIVLPILQADLKGFNLDLAAEYRESSARRTASRGSIKVTVPCAGNWYPAFIFYDDIGAERIGLYVNGQREGIAVATEDVRDQKLFTLQKPLSLKVGDIVELRNLNALGNYRTEDLLLLHKRPLPSVRHYQINNVAATVDHDGDALPQAGITFISSWATVPRVEWGTDANSLNGRVEGLKETPLNNHRFILPGLKLNQKYFYRVVATGGDGKTVVTETKSFSTTAPKYPVAKVARRLVPLKLSSSIPAGQVWPVTTGVPLPQGEVFEAVNLRVLDGTREAPAQITVLGRWRDGSIKWALLDIQASGAPNYALEYGAQVHRVATPKAVIIQQTPGEVTLDTGVLRVAFAKNSSGLFTQIWRDENGDGKFTDNEAALESARAARLELVGQDGKTYSSLGAPDEIVVEESGPLRAVVRVRGALKDATAPGSTLFRYTLRLHAFAGSPLLKLQATLENDATQNTFTSVKSASLILPLDRGNESVRAAVGGAGEADLTGNGFIRIFQDFDNSFSASGVVGEKKGVRAPGWAQWQSGNKSVSLAVRDFWQQYPMALQASRDGLRVDLMPALAPDQYDRFKGTVEAYRSVFYLMDGAYKLRMGMTKTHEMLLSFGASGSVPSGEELAQPANRRALLVASPQWYRDSKALREYALDSDHPQVARYGETIGKAFEDYHKDRERNHEYGMLNFGDWWGERGINWGNIEYDTQHGMFGQFVRTGDARYFFTGEEAELHNRDVDTVHYYSDPNRVGQVHIHSIGHSGGYFTQSPVEGQGSPGGGFTVSHTWAEGHVGHYFLSGDRRSMETARKIADVFNTYYTRNYDYTNARESGWHLILTMALYEATGDPFYLNAARIIVDRVLERQTPNGGWDRQLVPGHCLHEQRHHGEAGFMTGVLMSGLKYYHLATGDERAAQSIIRGSHWTIDDLWSSAKKSFRYTSCPTSSYASSLTFLQAEGLSYAWRLQQAAGKRDDRLRRVLLEAYDPALQSIGGMGKNFSQQARSSALTLFDMTPMWSVVDNVSANVAAKIPGIGEGAAVQFDASGSKVLAGRTAKYEWDFGDGSRGVGQKVSHAYPRGGSYTARLLITDSKSEQDEEEVTVYLLPPVLQNADPKQLVLVEAENFAAQGKGEVRVMRDRINTSGTMITYWEQSPGHWLEWKVNVPQNGRYKIVLKYTTASEEAKRDFQIDDKLPHPSLQNIVLPGTGGYSTGEDTWKFFTLGGDEKPLEIELSAGEHTLRMSNLGGGLGLDYLMLSRVS